MLLEVLIPIRFTTTSGGVRILFYGTLNALITIVMVFAIAWAVHKGWDVAG